MSNRYTNVVVHVSGHLGPTERTGIEQAVAAQDGVGRAVTSPKAERLILVDYDPFTISAQRILETVRVRGVRAQLIGM